MFEEGLSKKAIEWKAEEIFGLLLILERKTKSGKKIVIRSLERKFYLIKSMFNANGFPLDPSEERKVRMALNVHIRKRLDKTKTRQSDRDVQIDIIGTVHQATGIPRFTILDNAI